VQTKLAPIIHPSISYRVGVQVSETQIVTGFWKITHMGANDTVNI